MNRGIRLYSYVVARDFGFAPNPFHGYCSLAACKPTMRRCANIGDLIIGIAGVTYSKPKRLLFAMRVSECITYDEYWADPRFKFKIPDVRGGMALQYGDNIYHSHAGLWIQEDSHHSNADGSPNPRNVSYDTQVNRVLVSDDFIYWGENAIAVPARVRFDGHVDLCPPRGFRSRFPAKKIENTLRWFSTIGPRGIVGDPFEWKRIRSGKTKGVIRRSH